MFYDNDVAGKRGAERLSVNRDFVVVGAKAGFKDVNEMLVNGEDINGWVCRAIEGAGLV